MRQTGTRQSRWRQWLALGAVVLAALTALVMCLSPRCCTGLLVGVEPADLFAPSCLLDHSKPRWYVAHALGEIDGVFYTDSLDAFLSNYEKGYRTFEVDLVLLKDGTAFCAHDGTEWMYGLDKPFTETTADELAGRLCLGKYTTLTASDLLALAYEYPDAHFILDTKRTVGSSNHDILRSLVAEAKATHPSVLDRVIPHTFGPADLWAAADIYPFRLYWVAVRTIRCNLDRKSGAEPDRVVLYAISSGGPAALRRTLRVTETCVLLPKCAAALLLPFSCPVPTPLSIFSDARLYISVDLMDGSQATPTP